MQIKKLAVVAGALGALTLSVLTAAPASADYAPSGSDVVGVGSDTVQYAIDFMADGDYGITAGYNAANRNKVINFDATPDANARLAYGSFGLNGTSAATSNCSPGTGGTAGTGNQNTTHTGDRPCVLNPSIVLRAGTRPVQRPNGSGAGFNALKADDVASTHNIDFARASSPRCGLNNTPSTPCPLYDSVTIGTDLLQMLTANTTNATAVSAAQLKSIYECSVRDWNLINASAPVGSTIIPILPQVGSGTRSGFLTAIGSNETAITTGGCAVNAEENDPEAIDASTSPINAIEPMSSGRLYMYKGLASDGLTSIGAGYFNDPSCAYAVTTPVACTTGKTLNPNVKYWDPATSPGAFTSTRNMYIYFRDADINSTTAFQTGGARNWVRTLYYNPCSGTTLTGAPISVAAGNCVSGGTYGPGGAPFINTLGGQTLVSSAGIVPSYAFTASGP
jgi:ABC-type phosphate transport system substrate-binding protein